MEHYHKIAKIGKGTFGDVVLVEKLGNKALFAMKRVYLNEDSHNTDKQLNGDTFNEVKLLSGLKHPNIVKYHEYFIHNEKLCIVMDYASSGDMQKKIKEVKMKQQRFTEKEIFDWVAQLLLAIKYLHDNKILHRDIKVQNIFLTNDGKLKLGDFGISKKLDCTLELAKTSLGTPYYLSPEICRSQLYSFKSDIWMLGCTIYDICALERPFTGDSLHEVIQSILNKEPDPLPNHINPILQRLVHKLLQKSVENRPTIDEILGMKEISTIIQTYIAGKPEYAEVARTLKEIRPRAHPILEDELCPLPMTLGNPVKRTASTTEKSDRNTNRVKSTSYAEIAIKPPSPAYSVNSGKVKLAQNSLNNILKKAKEAMSPTFPSAPEEHTPWSVGGEENKSSDNEDFQLKCYPKTTTAQHAPSKFTRSYQKTISINTANLEESENRKDSTKSQEESKRDVDKNQIPTVKMQKKNFSFADTIFNPQGPTSPNRSVLFSDFLKQRLGPAKFEEMGRLLEGSKDPLKILDEENELVTGILGHENLDCIKIFKYLISNSVTPAHQRSRSLQVFVNQREAKSLLESRKGSGLLSKAEENSPSFKVL